MSDSQLTESVATPTDGIVQFQSFLEGLTKLATAVAIAVVSIYEAAEMEIEKADRAHGRAELLVAYKQRHRWRKSDIPRLESLNPNGYARARMRRLEGRGRPIVAEHRPLGTSFLKTVRALHIVNNPATTPMERRRAMKNTPWWAHHVEALYRGEYALAKESRTKGPSAVTEEKVGRALGLSASTVHSICSSIRRERRRWEGAANFPPMTLDAYEDWMNSGQNPRWIDEAHEAGPGIEHS